MISLLITLLLLHYLHYYIFGLRFLGYILNSWETWGFLTMFYLTPHIRSRSKNRHFTFMIDLASDLKFTQSISRFFPLIDTDSLFSQFFSTKTNENCKIVSKVPYQLNISWRNNATGWWNWAKLFAKVPKTDLPVSPNKSRVKCQCVKELFGKWRKIQFQYFGYPLWVFWWNSQGEQRPLLKSFSFHLSPTEIFQLRLTLWSCRHCQNLGITRT